MLVSPVNSFTYEPSMHYDRELTAEAGKTIGLAFYDILQPPPSPPEPEKPTGPDFAWTFDGHVEGLYGEVDGEEFNAEWEADTPFEYEGNKSLKLDGSNAYVDIGGDVISRETLTVSVWVKAPASSVTRYVVSDWWLDGPNERSWAVQTYGNHFNVLLSRDGTFDTGSVKNYQSSGIEIWNNEWRHLAFTYESDEDGGALRMFLDGAELKNWRLRIDSDASVPSLHAGNGGLRIGATRTGQSGEPTRWFDGLIDEVAIWNSALTPAEISWLAQNSIRERH